MSGAQVRHGPTEGDATVKLEVTINSGMAYLMSFVGVIVMAFALKASFNEVWIAIAALYGWHTGRRLWRQLKLPNGTEMVCDDTPNGGGAK